MWIPLVLNEVNYLLKCPKQSTIKLYITDFKEMWCEELTQTELIDRFQEINPLFDTDLLTEEELVERVLSMVSGEFNPAVQYILTKQSDHLILNMKSKQEFSIKYRFNLGRTDYETFFHEFTLPLMQTVQYLEMRQKQLFDILERKDKEIQEHVLENGELTRKALVTKRFDREQTANEFPRELLVNVFGKSKVFYEAFSKEFGVVKYKGLTTKTAKVKTDGV